MNRVKDIPRSKTNTRIAPGPRGSFLLGSLPDMQRKGQLQLMEDAWREYGDVVRFKMGPLVQHLFVQPEHLKHILLTHQQNYSKGIGFAKVKFALGNGLFVSEGDLWRQQRRLMHPPFTARAVEQFAQEMVEAAGEMMERWEPFATRREALDVNQETMRLYPPVWAFPRDAIEEDEIGGYHIPKGSMVLVSQYLTHRHPEFWDNPEVFDPERFTPERSEDRPRYAFFPFGVGPRICLGIHFAYLEAHLVLATVAQRYRLDLVPGHPVEAKAVGTLRPIHGVRMTLHPR